MSEKESEKELPPFDVVETLCSIEPDEKTYFHLKFSVGDVERNPVFTFDEMNPVLNSCGFRLCQRDERVMKEKIEELSNEKLPVLA